MRSVPRFATAVLALAISILASATGAFAQNAQGTILGHITDPSGAVVANAQVTILNLDTGVRSAIQTNANGDYDAPALNPGNYSVSVEAAGFSKSVADRVVLEVQQTLRQDFKLAVGAVTNTVQVSAESQMLHTEDQTIGQVLQADLIQALPVNGRDFTNLMITNVGTNITPGGSGTDWGYHGLNQQYMEVSANGAQAQSTSYSIDGIYDADFFFSVPINIPNELSIQEFKMMNGIYGAQYGQGAAQVNVDIKSGTNSIHGAAYEALEANWLQPDSKYQEAVNAANPSSTSPVIPVPPASIWRRRRRPVHHPPHLQRPRQDLLVRQLRRRPLQQGQHAHLRLRSHRRGDLRRLQRLSLPHLRPVYHRPQPRIQLKPPREPHQLPRHSSAVLRQQDPLRQY